MNRKTLTHTVGPDDAGDRLDRLIARAFPDLSRSRGKALIEEGAVIVGGATVTDPSYRVKPDHRIAVTVPEPKPARVVPQKIPLDIRYEDDDLLVVDKPAGLVVHPAPGHAEGTLVNALLAHCGDSLSGIGGIRRPGIVHRIDKDTSGLLVVAKNDTAHIALAKQFERHTIERVYTAVVWGGSLDTDGTIEGNIGRSSRNRKKMAVVSAPHGKPALTRFKAVRRLGLRAAVVECRLATGRTHQIRVHCAHIGHAIVGDPLYGRSSTSRLAGLSAAQAEYVRRFSRQALHATVIGFEHPTGGKMLRFTSSLPNDINGLISILET